MHSILCVVAGEYSYSASSVSKLFSAENKNCTPQLERITNLAGHSEAFTYIDA